ncbi:hypothetical protein P1P68_07985 [Streptomyces scabiei]|nr:hypothetical protein [Streptomyces scabiei]MDW8804727.1 hypothetical protein [Streptomyces scabiei]
MGIDVDQGAFARVEEHALDVGSDALDDLLVDERDDGVGAQVCATVS